MKQSDFHDVFSPIKEELEYWLDPGTGDRLKDDRDCQLTGSLNADTIISLWLPLRFTLNRMGKPLWHTFLDYEYAVLRPKLRLKNCPEFLSAMIERPEAFLNFEDPLVQKLSKLMRLGMQRENVMILPDRRWNSLKGCCPYFDYMPHFLYDLFDSQKPDLLMPWLKQEHLEPFFEDGILDQAHIRDFVGTGTPRSHHPRVMTRQLHILLDHYINFLEERRLLMDDAAAA